MGRAWCAQFSSKRSSYIHDGSGRKRNPNCHPRCAAYSQQQISAKLLRGWVSLPCAINRQTICSNIALICIVPLDPDELRPAALALPLLEPVSDRLYEILVLDGPAARFPSVPLPVDVPFCYALDRIFAVGADLDVLGIINGLERTEDGRELCPLVRLHLALQPLRYISVGGGWLVPGPVVAHGSQDTNLGSDCPK